MTRSPPGDLKRFIGRVMFFPMNSAYHHALAIEELSFAIDACGATGHRAWLNYVNQAFMLNPVATRRDAREWTMKNLDPNPVASHKLATQQFKLEQKRRQK